MNEHEVEVQRKSGFTVVGNFNLDDKRLSFKARGLLVTMLRLPEDWDYTIAGLATLAKDGKASVRSAIEELESLHYIRRTQLRGEGGTFVGNKYTVYEEPYDSPLSENRITENRLTENRITENPLTENPLTENPLTENRTEPNTNIPSTKETKPPKAPRGGRRPKSVPDHEPEMFERFWRAYPRGEDRQGAAAEWDKLRPDMALMRVMSTALERQKATEEWQRGIGVPYAVRWLRKRRWEDETRTIPAAPPETGYIPEINDTW